DPPRNARAIGSERKLRLAAASRTRAAVAAETRCPRRAYETPAVESPVSSATSRSVARLRGGGRSATMLVNRFTNPRSAQMRIDLHEHLWPEAFVSALAGRGAPPCIRGRAGDRRLELAYEPGGPFSSDAHDLDRRLATLDELEIDVAVISISTPVGVEALPEDEARPLLDA